MAHGQGGRRLEGSSSESIREAAKDAVKKLEKGRKRVRYRVAEIQIEASSHSPGEVDVYMVYLDEIGDT